MNRREFIASALSGGALLATADLPMVAAEPASRQDFKGNDDPSCWTNRDQRLSLCYARVEAGAAMPFSVLHISDTHLCAVYPDEPEFRRKLRVRNRGFGGLQEKALSDSLAYGKRNCDYVLHTGDFIDWPSEANFDLVRKYLGDKEIFGCLGNHEWYRDGVFGPQDEATRQKSVATLQKNFPFDIVLHSQVIQGVNFVTLDNVFGTINRAQFDRFEKEVQKGLPIILCCHVPFYTDLLWTAHEKSERFDNCRARGMIFDAATVPATWGDRERQRLDKTTTEFMKYLKAQPLLKAILCGHTHFTMQDRFSPTAMEYIVGANFMFHAEEILVV